MDRQSGMQKIVSYLGYLLGPGYPTSNRDQAPMVEKGQAPIGQRVPTREKGSKYPGGQRGKAPIGEVCQRGRKVAGTQCFFLEV